MYQPAHANRGSQLAKQCQRPGGRYRYLWFIFALLGASTSACGAKLDSTSVTETGNPSFIDKTRINVTPLEGGVEVSGERGAVPDDATVKVTNERTKKSVTTNADGDGAFSVRIDAKPDDELVITVQHEGDTATLRVNVADVDTTDPAPTDSDATDPNTTHDGSDDATSDDTSDTVDAGVSPTLVVPENHRPEAVVCDEERPPGYDGSYPVTGECESDDDCVAGERGRCTDMRGLTVCTYDECVDDSACPTGGPCGCEQGFWAEHNVCLAGNCRLDSDCGVNGYCSPTLGDCGNYTGIIGYWCHTPEDECVNDSQCASTSESLGPGYCMYASEVGHWVCSYTHCVG